METRAVAAIEEVRPIAFVERVNPPVAEIEDVRPGASIETVNPPDAEIADARPPSPQSTGESLATAAWQRQWDLLHVGHGFGK